MLSILIPTLHSRADKLKPLEAEILRQVSGLPKRLQKVEIITCPDNGEMTIGAKRQHLLDKCTGKYCVYVDDDDDLKPDYLSEIMKALKDNPDCVGFKGVMITNGSQTDEWEISHRHKNWAKSKSGYVRHTNHLTPVKTEIARKVGFKNVRHAEDYEYSMGLLPLLKTEVFIDKQLYVYKYESKK